MNRQELRRALNASKGAPHGNGNDKDNVTDSEVTAFGAYEQALTETKRAQAEKTAADKALVNAMKSNNADAIQLAKERQRKAAGALRMVCINRPDMCLAPA